MAGTASQQLDDDDAARLGMDTPENPMVVTAVVRLDGPLDVETLLRLIDERIFVHEHMRARVVREGLLRRGRWREVPASARHHVTHVELTNARRSPDALADLVSDLMTRTLDPSSSPWHLWLVDGATPGSTLVFRIHHALADGIALLGLLFSFSDEGAVLGGPRAPLMRSAHEPPPLSPSARGAFALRANAADTTRPSASAFVRRAAELARLFVRRADAAPVRAPLSGHKRIAWTAPIDLALMRRAAHVADAHINDLWLGILAGALRELGHGAATTGTHGPSPVHALVPVALRHASHEMGNDFVSVFVRLPVEVASPIERVHAARDAMRVARAHEGVGLGRLLVAGASIVGKHAERAAVRALSHKASLVATNLAGPPVPLHVAGREIAEIVFASPAPGSVALTANAFSYAGQLRVTIASDVARVPDPTRVARVVEAHARATIAALLALEDASATATASRPADVTARI